MLKCSFWKVDLVSQLARQNYLISFVNNVISKMNIFVYLSVIGGIEIKDLSMIVTALSATFVIYNLLYFYIIRKYFS